MNNLTFSIANAAAQQTQSASSVMRDISLPQSPTLEERDDGWTIHESSELQAAHTTTDVIMCSSNGRIGIKGNTELVDAVVQNHVMVAGTHDDVREEHPAQSLALPSVDEHLPVCYVIKVLVSDGAQQCRCREMSHRRLSLQSGVTTFVAHMGSSSIAFSMEWRRFASLREASMWWAQLRIYDFEVSGEAHVDHIVVTVDLEFETRRWDAAQSGYTQRRDGSDIVQLDATLVSSGQIVSTLSMAKCTTTATAEGGGAATNIPSVAERLANLVTSNDTQSLSPRHHNGSYMVSSPSSSEVDGAGGGASSFSSAERCVSRHRRNFAVPLSGNPNQQVMLTLAFNSSLHPPRRCGTPTSFSAPSSPMASVTDLEAIREREVLEAHFDAGFDSEVAEQQRVLGAHWSGNKLEVRMQDDAHANRLLLAMRFNSYTLFCNGSGCAATTGIHKNGLSCEGPHGQVCFQDYLYLGLYYCLTTPQLAANMVANLYAMLPSARRLAAKLRIPGGALFPFSTISGNECGSYFLNSTARFHINADVAYVVSLYLQVESLTREAQLQCLEIMLETARIWLHLGQWLEGHSVFTIDDVTGPDAYSGLVMNNFYTNLAARRHMLSACELYENLLTATRSPDVLKLLESINMRESTVAALLEAANGIVIHRDDRQGVYFAHEHFDAQPPWPANTMTRYPLSLNYHPLVIYRHKVCEFPEVLLGMLLSPERFERSDFRKNLQYYEPLCTGDNSMSLAVITATKFRAWGEFGKGTEGLKAAVQLDMESILPIADEGLHLSAMTSGWFIIAFGVCKMKIQKATLHLSPDLPVGWESCVFSVRWRQALVRVTVTSETVAYELVEGDAARLVHFDTTRVHLHSGTTHVKACPIATFPRAVQQQVTAHFDGVIFMLEAIVENLGALHFTAWRNSLERFFDEVRRSRRVDIPSLTFDEYVERVLYQVEESDLQYTGLNELLQARGIEMELGNPTDVEIVETRFGLANAKLAEMTELLRDTQLRLVDGVKDLLVDLRRLGLRVAVVSYTRSMSDVLRQLPILASLCTTSIDGIEARAKRFRGRPHTDLFVKAARKMHLSTDRCVVIGCEFDRGYKSSDLHEFHVFLDVLRPLATGSNCGPSFGSAAMAGHVGSAGSLGVSPVDEGGAGGPARAVLAATPGSDALAPVINVPQNCFPSSVSVLEDWIIERHRRRRTASLLS